MIKKLLFILVLISIILACEKSETSDKTPSLRIKQIDAGHEIKDFIYEGNRLSKMIISRTDRVDTTIYEFSYSGDEVFKDIYLYSISNSNYSFAHTQTYLIKDNHVKKRTIYYNDGKGPPYKISYQKEYDYSGDQLISMKVSSFDDGLVSSERTKRFIYDGQNIMSINHYKEQDYNIYCSDKFFYENNRLSNIEFCVAYSSFSTWELEYEGDMVRKIFLSDNTLIGPEKTYIFSNEGLLLEVISEKETWDMYRGDFIARHTTTYIYEEGIGNARLFYYQPENLVYDIPRFEKDLPEL